MRKVYVEGGSGNVQPLFANGPIDSPMGRLWKDDKGWFRVAPDESKPQGDVLTIPEVCAALSLGETKVNELISNRDLPSLKLGKAVRVRRSSLEKFIADREAGIYRKRGR